MNCDFVKMNFIILGDLLLWVDKRVRGTRNSFGCKMGSYPIHCFGIPTIFRNIFRKMSNSDWKGMEDRIEKRLI